ncbi:MAG: hypothetical protein JJU36_07060 [Phycisphaeraceae bacterium]|nr:hypothetical protein [Phycisphaeraceae bacterium]
MAGPEKVPCACGECVCQVDPKTGVEKNGQYYCCEACATNHEAGAKGHGCKTCDCGC